MTYNPFLSEPSPNCWENVAEDYRHTRREDFWRIHLKRIYQNLFDSWTPQKPSDYVLKTDLFDEAASSQELCSLFAGKCRFFVGIDISMKVAQLARQRLSAKYPDDYHSEIVSDAARLPFQSETFDLIFSPSTLDHFSHKEAIRRSLKELHRVLKVNGTLIMTLDNAQNPLIFLRNWLPSNWLRRLGAIPFSMGVTLTRSEFIRYLEDCDFVIQESAAIVHAPRALAIRLGQLIQITQSKNLAFFYFKLLNLFERLGGLPTQNVTGYFIAAKAAKK
jgi:SAM-dependent methyltransferase